MTPNYGGQPSPEKAKRGSRTCWFFGWRASRSSGVSRAKAGPDKGKKVIAGDFQPFKILANYNEDMLADKWRIP
jgi:hypothetical protein